jgi:anti-anti-sigma regulatory factor
MTTIRPAGRCVIVDLAELEFADCAALNGLREVQNLARQGGGDMLLAEPSGIVLRLLTLTERFAIYASVAAVATCKDSPRYEAGRPAVSPAAPGKTSPLSTAA